MSRKRLSWYNKTADPYTLNQDREDFDSEKYLTGDPSSWAESPHQPLPDDEALGRNEVGHPNMSEWNLTHKDVDDWYSDESYDNDYTFSDRDRNWTVEASDRRDRSASRDVHAHLERKAFQCVKIADALLPDAPESLVEDQAFDLMSLSDEAVIATAIRIAEEHAEEEKKEEKEDEDIDEDDVESMLREMIAEEDKKEKEKKEDKDEDKDGEEAEDKDGDDEKESSQREDLRAMVRTLLAEEDEKEKDEDKDDKADDEEEEDSDEDVEALLREMISEEKDEKKDDDDDADDADDEEVEAMIQDMMNGQADELGGAAHDAVSQGLGGQADTNMDIQLEPTMDTVSSEIQEDDTVLSELFADTVPAEAHKEDAAPAAPAPTSQSKQASGGVQTLGGRVKEAADGGTESDEQLSGLWQSDPDVSDIF